MFIKRVLLAGAVVGVIVALFLPHSSGDRTVFVVSGGGLKRPVSFDSKKIGPARGWWWHQAARVPQLTGSQYRLRFYNSASAETVTEWTYLPQASGALSVLADGLRPGVERIVWMAFTPAFNAGLIAQLDGPFDLVDSHALQVLLATGAGILLLMTAAGFRLYAPPMWLLRFVKRKGGAVAFDSGPAYLYTSVPRAQWPWMGRLGRAPASRLRAH
ncbi:MAG TPA: hypothetical protein VKV69_09835 [Actinomycetota bacterium]|nr:hypothetical protein [Actinomycetota bacterium]